MTYDPGADPVHGTGWNSAARWGGWHWDEPRGAEHFRCCSFCGSIHPEDLAAETAGDGVCRVCGKHGWEACFRNQQPRWDDAEREAVLAKVSPEERARATAMAPAHTFDSGGWRASWADQKYGWPHKFYVEGLLNRSPERKRVITALSEEQYEEMLAGKGWPARSDAFEWHRPDDIPAGYVADGWRCDRYAWLGFGSDATHHAKFYSIHLADPQVSADVKDTIARVSGLRFHFTEGAHVRWEAYP